MNMKYETTCNVYLCSNVHENVVTLSSLGLMMQYIMPSSHSFVKLNRYPVPAGKTQCTKLSLRLLYDEVFRQIQNAEM